MTVANSRYIRHTLTLLLGVFVFFFWWKGFPQALNFQEQYQLFMFDADYLSDHFLVAGGLSDYLAEFLTQFYYLPWAGALILAVLFMLVLRGVWSLFACRQTTTLLASFIPVFLLLWHMGDENVMLSYVVALLAALFMAKTMRQVPVWVDVVVAPLFFWLFGPMVWLYAALRVVQGNWRRLWLLGYVLAVALLAYYTVLGQWPLTTVLLTMCYYRTPMQTPLLQVVIPMVVVVLMLLPPVRNLTIRRLLVVGDAALLALVAYCAVTQGYQREKYELIRQDDLIRHERWSEVIERAQRFQVKTAFSSVSVNLALAMTRQLADRMFSFYQSGHDALIMPSIRDMTSNLPSAEAFWRLGMVNSAQRYMFDIQESILNGKKSARCTQRIAECMIVNGHYATARKQLALLKKTLFYRQWALDAERIMSKEAWVNTHPVWGKLRRLRYKDDMLYSYPELEKMFGLLFVGNQQNTMALDYMMAEHLLKGQMQEFAGYLPWVQQYGGYKAMPVGYRDVVNCIQQKGNVTGSPYASYVNRMMNGAVKK